tara:strand:+ start:973 stop:1239 length:267 start_codon:yes stop_codon:yes gene_type:complete
MKLTKAKLKEIIIEELAVEAEDETAKPEEKLKSDVETILKKMKGYIEKIDTPQEYGQLLNMVLNHPVDRKALVLRKLKDTFLAGMKGK